MWVEMENGEDVNFDKIRKIKINPSSGVYQVVGEYENGDLVTLSDRYVSFESVKNYKAKLDRVLKIMSL